MSQSQSATSGTLSTPFRFGLKGKEKERKPKPLVTSYKETLEEKLRRLSRQREVTARIQNNMAKTALVRQQASIKVDEYETMKQLSREITIVEWESKQIRKTNDTLPEITQFKRRLESRAESRMCPRFRMKHIKHARNNVYDDWSNMEDIPCKVLTQLWAVYECDSVECTRMLITVTFLLVPSDRLCTYTDIVMVWISIN